MAIKGSIDSSRLESLNGMNFRMWQRHIIYVLTHEKTQYTLTSEKPDRVDLIDGEAKKMQEKWEEDDLMGSATLLHNMKDNIIPLFEGHEFAKEMIEALETKYGLRFDTHIQLLLDKYNCSRMNDGENVGEFVNQMELIAKELANAGHPVTDKMQVTTILNNLPLSWEHVVTSLTLSGKEVSMVSLLVLLVLEEERMKRGRHEGTSSNMMMAHTIPKLFKFLHLKASPKSSNKNGKVNPMVRVNLKEHVLSVEKLDTSKQNVQNSMTIKDKRKLQ